MDRKKLKKGQVIKLKEENTGNVSEFEIISSIANGETKEGGSSVCYSAQRNGEMGRLKEFYPCDDNYSGIFYSLERCKKSNQLVPVGNMQEICFYEACDVFTDSYKLIEKIKKDEPKCKVLNNYMPSSVLYCGFEGNKRASVYVWTKDDKEGVRFSDYIKEIHKSPKKLPGHKLYNIIEALISLTDFLIALHSACILHLDIKPSNFLVNYDSQFNINPNSISVFDINSIYDLSNRPLFCGTDGFRAPELIDPKRTDEIFTGTDIYSVGAILYNALFSTKENSVVYKREIGLHDIEKRISECDLIKYSGCNSDVKIKCRLAKVLRKCLADSIQDRYLYCDHLIEDLRYIATRLLSYANNSSLPPNEQLRIIDSDARVGVNPTAVIQNLLYKNPLYIRELNSDNKAIRNEINVVTIGAGEYSQKFIDQCLQCGQMCDRYLKITAISSESEEDMASYLSFRPELKNFVNINCEYSADNNDMYADLYFASFVGSKGGSSVQLSKNNKEGNLKIFNSTLENINLKKEAIDYIFVSLGDDKLNQFVAKQLYDLLNKNTFVCFAYSGVHKRFREIVPVYIDENIEAKNIAEGLEQMAFNVHLSWCDNLNINILDARKKFKEPYNYNSSIAMALSIKYKLHSVNIELEDRDAAAKKFYDEIIKKNDSSYKKLITLEHRRWIFEKVCDGWVCRKDLDECLNYPPNDKKNKKHVCILKCDDKLSLKTYFKSNAKWDNATADELKKLDELDRMSVKLHRVYKKEADKSVNVLSGEYVKRIKSLISSSKEADYAFSELLSCMKLIKNGVNDKTKDYRSLLDSFAKKLEGLPPNTASEIKANLKILDRNFASVLKSMEYVDYKENDATIINNIPFILTYTNNKHIVVPFSFGNVSKDFANAASAMMINPSNITYLVYIQSINELRQFEISLFNTKRLLSRMNILANLGFHIILDSSVIKSEKAYNDFKVKLSRNKIKHELIISNSMEALTESIGIILEKISSFDALEINETNLSYLMIGAGLYEKYPCYKFDSSEKVFSEINNCSFLNYIKGNQYLKVDDMFAMDDSQGDRYFMPEFYKSHEYIWNLYRNNSKIWKLMCSLLAEHSKSEDVIFHISLSRKDEEYAEKKYLLPTFTYESIKKILDYLINESKIIDDKSSVNYYNSESCEVIIQGPNSYFASFEKMFSNPYLLMNSRLITFVDKTYSLEIKSNNLISGLINFEDYPDFVKHSGKIKWLLRQLNEIGLISVYNPVDEHNSVGSATAAETKNTISISYSSYAVKDLLTNEGRILEIEVYHKCISSGIFDDIVSGYEISWQGSDVKNELDIVATKGTRSFFIECKAVANLNHEYYYKIQSLAEKFGINATPIIIADTQNDKKSRLLNEKQKLRGEMMGVVTVNEKSDIDNIDRTLERIINTKFSVK